MSPLTQYAQAGPVPTPEPIGQIDTVTGKVQVTHTNGVVEVLSNASRMGA